MLAQLGPALAERLERWLGRPAAYETLDGLPVPLMRRCRGQRHRLFGAEAGIGRGGSDKDWYYGARLVLTVNSDGMITGFALGPAPTEERWLAEALFRWRRYPAAPPPTAAELAPVLGPRHHAGGRVGPTGPVGSRLAAGRPFAGPTLADRLYAGAAWRRHWRADFGVAVLTKADYAALPPGTARDRAVRWLDGLRQVAETVNGALIEPRGLSFPRARTAWGLLTRIAAKVAAHNLARLVNPFAGRPTFSVFNPLD